MTKITFLMAGVALALGVRAATVVEITQAAPGAQALTGEAQEGDYAAAEPFFKAALSGKGSAAPQPVVMNDYADTLRHLKRCDEAESLARRAIAASGGRVKLYELTLAQILRDAGKDLGEMDAILAQYERFGN